VEGQANVPGEPIGPAGSKVEQAPKKSHKRQGPAPKARVDELADSVKDIYSIMDSLIGSAIAFTGKEYPAGLFEVSDSVALKLARNLLIVNNSIPKVGAQVSKIAAPLLLLTTFLTDISMKVVILNGILKSPKVSPGNSPTLKG
jgi:hypothetical protein